ncbi:MAG: glycosyltransferase [Holosporales bacterium]|jgi:undecaprenyl-phosphate 4-deoxy-4-formamido-L-arabinose transferase|nr:glycosyltransferase [Holosporales bacterium]
MFKKNAQPHISVVAPIYNEEENILELFDRLFRTMESVGKSYEIIFVNDGSKDSSAQILEDIFQKHKETVRIIEFNNNYGQYIAVFAGFEHVRGQIIITLDADLQNPPEDIIKLLAKVDEGHDLVGGYREHRQDGWFRTHASKFVNGMRDKLTGLHMRDHGCMLRAYSRDITEQVIKTREAFTFITAMAQKFAKNPIDIPVKHSERKQGMSKYSLYKLIRIGFDLLTGFSLIPLQMFTLIGVFTSLLSGALVVYLVFRRIFIGPEVEGVFTLFALLFFMMSVLITGIGLIGEYVGRAYLSLCNHPRYVIRKIIEKRD